MKCNFCHSSELELLYTPVDSKINLEIHICPECGLVQSSYDKNLYENSHSPIQTEFDHLSCNASYSEVRVGKQQMVNYIFDILEKENINFAPLKVLDVKSARGHFALKALDYFKLDHIDCIEEDEYMTLTYKDNPKISIFNQKYHKFPKKDYDLVYSCHTLEHYQNPSKYLAFIKTLLKKDGMFYIDVPNIDNIDHSFNLDEFFYDKHLFYYDTTTLKTYIESLGFKLIGSKSTPQNVGLLFQNSSTSLSYPVANQYLRNKNLVESYKDNITINRKKLAQLDLKFSPSQTNLIFGCGRPLDTFIQYGGLDINQFNYLVDDFLSSITSKLYKKPLYNSSILDQVQADNILLLVKHPTKQLLDRFKGSPNIIFLKQLLDG